MTRKMIPGFWDVGPHDPLEVEATWQEFVRLANGEVVSDILPEPRNFQNADFFFSQAGVVAELKEIETEFSTSNAFYDGFGKLITRVIAEDPSWRPPLLGGDGSVPNWFNAEFVRIFRPALSRILKKANRQLRETKEHFGIKAPTGVLFLVNDGFTAIGPNSVRALAANLLMHSYSSIDCLVYLTVNRYVELVGSDTPRLVWIPLYSERAPSDLVEFIDKLGRQWFDFLEKKVGDYTSRLELPATESAIFDGSRALIIPGEK